MYNSNYETQRQPLDNQIETSPPIVFCGSKYFPPVTESGPLLLCVNAPVSFNLSFIRIPSISLSRPQHESSLMFPICKVFQGMSPSLVPSLLPRKFSSSPCHISHSFPHRHPTTDRRTAPEKNRGAIKHDKGIQIIHQIRIRILA